MNNNELWLGYERWLDEIEPFMPIIEEGHMNRGIELNGLANIKLTLDAVSKYPYEDISSALSANPEPYWSISQSSIDALYLQIDLLQRYMIAYAKAVDNGEPIPAWHDIRSNPNRYPTNNNR